MATTKTAYAEMKLQAALVEEKDYDLLVMGRTEGKGCYCYVNGLLQAQMKKIQNNYPYVVVDNEAGLEHISRGLVPQMNTAILVSDCSRRGVLAAARIAQLIQEMDMHPQKIGLIVNRAMGGVLSAGITEEIERQGLALWGVVPHDDNVYDYDSDGKAAINLPSDSPVKAAMKEIISRLGL